jgi:hypothetical protein
MLEFRHLFPEIGMDETRSAIIPKGGASLPRGQYFFLEAYCTDKGCDCRRVMLRVMWTPVEEGAPGPQIVPKEVAWILHAFEPPPPDAHVPEQTMLDPLNPQSELAEGVLDLFNETVIQDPAYRERLVRHYRMVKDAIATKGHPIHRQIAAAASARRRSRSKGVAPGGAFSDPYELSDGPDEPGDGPERVPEPDPYAPCPCGSGKKYKWCCREKQLRYD